MDIASYLQCFEGSLSSYTGDDPLDPWDKFVEHMEQRLPADGGSGMSLVFDRLVQRFLNVEQYANDIRYVTYCIKCAGYYSDPIALYSHIYSKGIGTRTAALYVAWAQQFEQRGMNEQAEAVYQRAAENQAQPADLVLHEHRQFQTRSGIHTTVSAGGRTPLQNSNLTNQMSSHREAGAQSKAGDCPPRPQTHRTTIFVSRSETSESLPSSHGAGAQTVSAYLKEALVCEGSELCFEEVRAEKYFRTLREKREKEEREMRKLLLRQQEEDILSMKCMLETVNQELQACGGLTSRPPPHRPSAGDTAGGLNPDPSQPSSVRPRPSNRPSNRRSLGLRFHTEPTFIREAAAIVPPQQPQPPLSPEVSQHAAVLAHTSVHVPESAATAAPAFQLAAAQDGRVQPGSSERHDAAALQETQHAEPEDNLDLSQGGTVNLSHVTPNTSLGFVHATPSRVLPSPTVNTREALDVIMDMFQAPTLPEEPFSGTSALHAAEADLHPGYAENDVSSLYKPPAAAAFTVFQDDDADKENGSAVFPAAAQKSKPVRALAEINVSNKPNDTPPELAPDDSAMWGARYNPLHSLAACPNSTSDFALLARCVSTPSTHKTPGTGNFFQDQENTCDGGDGEDEGFLRRQQKKLSPILEQSPLEDTAFSQLAPSSGGHGTIVGEGLSAAPCLTGCSLTMAHAATAALSFRDHTVCPPGWEACSPAPPRPAEPFAIMEDSEEPRVQDVPMSPECAPKPDWLSVGSPEVPPQPDLDLDAFLSPGSAPGRTRDVPMSPRPLSPVRDQPMASPGHGRAPAPLQLVSDPWDEQLISDLLSSLAPPLTAHPRCFTWRCNLPSFSPKTTISMGKASLRVDGVLGEGAFAKVYQATDPATSERMVLKVQKPANPWEFYMHTQLAARLRPDLRRLFGSVHSAHLFDNGSVLLGALHGYGTLLNAVNIYRSLSEKVMPQPLVMYFAVRILHMVEQLHAVRIIHADIKPDNFLLGESFLENRRLEAEDADHGLVLVDLGQSIDMQLFPDGAAFTARCLTSGFQCTEMLSGKPWNYQTDYFGVAGTVHCLLFGTYMQVTSDGGVWRTNGVFRRNPHGELWQDFFHTLLNVSDCSSPPSLRGLRSRLEAALLQNYGGKLATLKSRLVVLLLESQRAARRDLNLIQNQGVPAGACSDLQLAAFFFLFRLEAFGSKRDRNQLLGAETGSL